MTIAIRGGDEDSRGPSFTNRGVNLIILIDCGMTVLWYTVYRMMQKYDVGRYHNVNTEYQSASRFT